LRTLICFLIMSVSVAAQTPRPLRRSQQERVDSPLVRSDRRVTFRLPAPSARNVTVDLEGGKPIAMLKDELGVWSATTDSLEPDIYEYIFNVDGVRTLDPANSLTSPNLLGASSMVHIPGPLTLPWEVNDVPHGVIHHQFFKSTICQDNRDFYVYTPPNYDDKSKTGYPVLYLLHNLTADASGWTSIGRVHVIMDNLIAQRKVKPMVVVMPLGYGTLAVLKSNRDPAVQTQSWEGFRDSLLREVIPRVERTYHVATDRTQRAIGGQSMGGSQSFRLGLSSMDQFAWIGLFSASPGAARFADTWSNPDNKANEKLKLLWMSCGKEDDLFETNDKLHSALTKRNIRHQWMVTPGAHTWLVWRKSLVEFVALLFR
jgi:enterochelin esterase-like enzyme